MNGIEKITERITAEANAACQEIAAAAAERCGAIRQEYEEKARDAYDQAFSKGKEEIEQFSRRQERTVRLDVKKDLLAQKQDLVSEAYRFARDRILGLPEEEYVSFLAREAGNAALTGREEIILSPADRERLGETVDDAATALAAAHELDLVHHDLQLRACLPGFPVLPLAVTQLSVDGDLVALVQELLQGVGTPAENNTADPVCEVLPLFGLRVPAPVVDGHPERQYSVPALRRGELWVCGEIAAYAHTVDRHVTSFQHLPVFIFLAITSEIPYRLAISAYVPPLL